MRLTNRVERGRWFNADSLVSPTWASVVAIGALLVIFGLDRMTGSAPVQHLYYLPIAFAGIRFRIRGGVAAALWAIVLYHLANPYLLTFRYEESDLLQIVLFVAAGVITAKVAHDARRLQQLAMTDDLTGLHNLRSFEAHLGNMVRTARQSHGDIALLVLDVDRLKALNDTYGHLTGAEAVRTVGHIIASRVPPDAVACRYGGDEFVIAIPGYTASDASDVAEELRRAVNETAPVLAGVPFPASTVSISIGLACRAFDLDGPDNGASRLGESLFREADAALYVAKERGRNQVCQGPTGVAGAGVQASVMTAHDETRSVGRA